MLEFLVNPRKAERKPWEMLFIGFFYAIISIAIATFFFYNNGALGKYSSIFVVTFTTIFSLPFMYFLIKLEEKKEAKMKDEKKVLKEHGKALWALLFLFLGFTIAYSLAFILMPHDITQSNFKAQLETYCSINPGDIKNCQGLTGAVTGENIKVSLGSVSSILANNFFVMITILVFSLLFGAGAIFILAWNASVIGTAIGLFSGGYIQNMPISLVRYLIHGVPEIAAYFVAALAGGIVGVAIIKHKFGKKEFWRVMRDSLDLIIIALVILILAAILEVFLTPVIVSALKV
jgi:uncharacterized membrane protein SpoIIM required for sporulation